MKNCELGALYQIFKCQDPLHKRKAPYWRLAGGGSGLSLCQRVFVEKKSVTRKGATKRSFNVIVCAAEEILEEEL